MNIDSIISVKLEFFLNLQPLCAIPPDINTTALVDSAANVSLLANNDTFYAESTSAVVFISGGLAQPGWR